MTFAEQVERPDVPHWTPWGDLTTVPPIVPANDNFPADAGLALPPLGDRPLLIGLTGKRNVGKSTVAALMEEEFGFERVHAFEAGKLAAREWFAYATGDHDLAHEMVYGWYKDQPSEYLPGNASPRLFLEKFGHFMGDGMGVDWTLGLEIARVRRRNPRAPIVVESLVYEAAWFKAQGGFVMRLERPGHVGPAGVASDAVQAAIAAHVTIATSDVEVLKRRAREVVQQMVGGA